MDQDVKKKLTDFIVENYLFGDAGKKPGDEDSLIENGIVDSTGILELIQFLESCFGIEVKDSETVPKNLDSIANLARFVMSKKG